MRHGTYTLTRWCLLPILISGAAVSGEDRELLASSLIQGYRNSKDIYKDFALITSMNKFIEAAKTWDKQRLNQEFDVLRAAAKGEESELLQAGMYGSATSLMIINPNGAELATKHWDAILDAVESSPVRGQASLLWNATRVKVALTDTQIERMTKMIGSVNPMARSAMVAAAAQPNPDHPLVLEVIKKLLDSHARGSLPHHDVSNVSTYLESVADRGSSSGSTLHLLEQIAVGGDSNWRPVALRALKQSRAKAPDAVNPILERLARQPEQQ